jgi:hypothetical protein
MRARKRSASDFRSKVSGPDSGAGDLYVELVDQLVIVAGVLAFDGGDIAA